MRLFIDTSVLLAACCSESGASREIFRRAPGQSWDLISTPYVVGEVLENLVDLPSAATAEWAKLRLNLMVLDDVVTLDRPSVFFAGKDRPILFAAVAWADVLLTLDRNDFGSLLGRTFYDLQIEKPGDFLQKERIAGRLKD